MRTEGVVVEERGREGRQERRKREGDEKGIWVERKGRCKGAGEGKGYGNDRTEEEERR